MAIPTAAILFPFRAVRGWFLDACAGTLELAHADSEFTPDERTHLRAAIQRHYGLDRPETADFGRNCLTARRMLERMRKAETSAG